MHFFRKPSVVVERSNDPSPGPTFVSPRETPTVTVEVTQKSSAKAFKFLNALNLSIWHKGSSTEQEELTPEQVLHRRASFRALKVKFEETPELPCKSELIRLCPYKFVLNDVNCRDYLKNFMTNSKSGEELLYFDAVKEFKHMEDVQQRRDCALGIIGSYIMMGAEKELNMSKNEKIAMATKFEKLPRDEMPLNFFDEVDRIVNFQLRTEIYPRFLDSKEFIGYFKKFRSKDLKLGEIPEIPSNSSDFNVSYLSEETIGSPRSTTSSRNSMENK